MLLGLLPTFVLGTLCLWLPDVIVVQVIVGQVIVDLENLSSGCQSPGACFVPWAGDSLWSCRIRSFRRSWQCFVIADESASMITGISDVIIVLLKA